jgi:Ca2+-binding EF-hand superfamily protein
MDPGRKKVVARAFDKLDADGSGWIDISDIRGVYVANKHPDVLAGKKTEDQILQEFLETFETAHAMKNNAAPNYVVTREEFDEYYNNISASIDDDAYFATMIINAWKLNDAPKKAAAPKGETGPDIFGNTRTQRPAAEVDLDLNANELQLCEHIRKRVAARGARGISGIGKKFKIADDNNSHSLDVGEFQKAMADFRMGLNPKQVTQAFRIFDRDGSGEISYDEFLRTIRGEMNEFRAAIAKRAYAAMDTDGSGQVDINDIRQTYNAKQHPDVKAGKKTEDEILMEFLDTFEDHFCDIPGNEDARDGKISNKEWLEYYNNVSMSIDDDAYFEAMMNSAWNLDKKRVTKKGWGGEV